MQMLSHRESNHDLEVKMGPYARHLKQHLKRQGSFINDDGALAIEMMGDHASRYLGHLSQDNNMKIISNSRKHASNALTKAFIRRSSSIILDPYEPTKLFTV